MAGLVQATNGYFYGAIELGGYNQRGTMFTINSAGKLKVIYQFCQTTCLATEPNATLIQALDGDLYGTLYGGAAYKMTPAGALTILNYLFEPWSGVIQATDGNFYGTTIIGGAPCAYLIGGCGTVYRMTPDGTLTTLHSFCAQGGCPDGAEPYAGVIQATDGNLYGLTSVGGSGNCPSGGCGVAFKMALDGSSFTVLNDLGVQGATEYPSASLVQATDGNFYGTGFPGVLFQMTPAGAITALYTFANDSSYASLIQATDGNLYGTTYGAVDQHSHQVNVGTVFRLSMGLGPFVKTQPPAGKVGKVITILGTNLAGATGVTFNGTPVTSFTVNSTNSAITTTVPAGATTGTVQVTLPGGVTLSSNVSFRVL